MDATREAQMRRLKTISTLMIVAALVAAACTGGSGQEEQSRSGTFRPSFEAVPCPDDVLGSIADFRSCGQVTVLEDRSEPQGRTIRLFVTQVKTPNADPSTEPVFTLGYDLGWQPSYEALAAMAERIHREVFILDPRGVGHSQPSLSCREVQALRTSSPAVSTGDPRVIPALMDAVAGCHDRLVGKGIDLSAYNLAEMAADVEDVRTALGVDGWTLAMRGTSSTVGFEVMRRFPDHVRAVFFDSPDAPQVDLFSEAIIGLHYAIARLSEACREDPKCQREFPDLKRTLRHDLLILRRNPAHIRTADGDLRLLDTTLVRWVRQWLATATTTTPSIVLAVLSHLPDDATEAIRSTLGGEILEQDDPLTTWAADPLTLNLGYAGPGAGPSVFSDGTFYSVVCHDELPFVDRQRFRDLAAGEPWFEDTYVDSPYLEACERWDVGRAPSDPHQPVTSDIPTLVVVGIADPFSPLPLVEEATRGLMKSWVVEFPSWGHNPFSSDQPGFTEGCSHAIRAGWIDAPTAPPDTSCIAEISPIGFELD
jgi:pimeloyl-ACP methyl ester carboxylesterase